MPTCSYCKKEYEIPRGLTEIQKDGTPKFFCSSKCRKNFHLGRNPKKLKWITKKK
ncbi:MAG: 50S ribosomal protein L24e [Candidatus Pacearchaeota archaeon]